MSCNLTGEKTMVTIKDYEDRFYVINSNIHDSLFNDYIESAFFGFQYRHFFNTLPEPLTIQEVTEEEFNTHYK